MISNALLDPMNKKTMHEKNRIESRFPENIINIPNYVINCLPPIFRGGILFIIYSNSP